MQSVKQKHNQTQDKTGSRNGLRRTNPVDADQELDFPLPPDKGFTQGAEESCLGWVVFFDALNEVQREYPFYVRHAGSNLIPMIPRVMRMTFTLSPRSVRPTIKAYDIISAFAAMFGIVFKPEKLRALTSRQIRGQLVLHDWTWTEITVDFGGMDYYITSLSLK